MQPRASEEGGMGPTDAPFHQGHAKGRAPLHRDLQQLLSASAELTEVGETGLSSEPTPSTHLCGSWLGFEPKSRCHPSPEACEEQSGDNTCASSNPARGKYALLAVLI